MCKTHAETKKAPIGRRWLKRTFRVVALFSVGFVMFSVLLAGWSERGQTALPRDDLFAGLEVLGVSEMTEKRGGFIDAALGISLNLGATILTAIDGSLVLKTLINFSDTGATSVTNTLTAAGAALPGLTFLSADGTAITGGIIPVVMNTTGPVTFAANGAEITLPAGFQGLVAQTDTGVVAAVNKITSEQFANLVISADPGAAVQQTLQIDINVQGFSALQRTVRLNATMEKFRETMRSASLSALGNN